MSCIINESGDHHMKRSPLGAIPSNNTPIQDTTSRLKSELQRCLNDQRQLRSELKHQQEQLDEKDAEIRTIREDENRLLVDLERQKDECSRYAKRVKLLQTDLTRIFQLYQSGQTADQDYTERMIEDIEKEFFASKQKYESTQIHQDNLIKELADVRNERNSLERRLQELTATRDDNHVESMDLKKLQDETEKLREMYLEASKSKEALGLELAELKRLDLDAKCREHLVTISSLEDRLKAEIEKSKGLVEQMNTEKRIQEGKSN